MKICLRLVIGKNIKYFLKNQINYYCKKVDFYVRGESKVIKYQPLIFSSRNFDHFLNNNLITILMNVLKQKLKSNIVDFL